LAYATYPSLSLIEFKKDCITFDDEKLEELTESIKQYGVLQPLIVQKKDGFYQIIAGERRWRAAKNAGLDQVPVIVKEYNSEETLAISLIENIQREDLSPIEEALAYKRLMEEHQLKQEEVAEKVGKSRSAIANFLRLLNLEESVQGMVADGRLSAGHAKVLLGIDSKEKQKKLAELTIQEELSVRQLEKLVQTEKKPKKEDETDPVEDLIYQSIGQRMQDILGTKVNIIQGKRKGKIEIEYYSPDDLERILDMINQIGQQ
jgi:ParB family chromosome partitioning protein